MRAFWGHRGKFPAEETSSWGSLLWEGVDYEGMQEKTMQCREDLRGPSSWSSQFYSVEASLRNLVKRQRQSSDLLGRVSSCFCNLTWIYIKVRCRWPVDLISQSTFRTWLWLGSVAWNLGGEGRDRFLCSSPFLGKFWLCLLFLFWKICIRLLLFVFSPAKCKFFVYMVHFCHQHLK